MAATHRDDAALRHVLHHALSDTAVARALAAQQSDRPPRVRQAGLHSAVGWTVQDVQAPEGRIRITVSRDEERPGCAMMTTTAHAVYVIKQGQRITAVHTEGAAPLCAADGPIHTVLWMPQRKHATTRVTYATERPAM